jgi:hypothetical protein
LDHTSHPLANLWGPFWVDLGVPKWPRKKQEQKKEKDKVFRLFWTIYPKRMVNDFVRSLFLSLDIEPYIRFTYRPLGTFLGQFGGAQISAKKTKAA